VVFGLIAVAGARIWVQNRVDLSQNSNLIMVAVTLVLGPEILLCRWAVYPWRDRYGHLRRDFASRAA
jgi:xanthine/uracil permease